MGFNGVENSPTELRLRSVLANAPVILFCCDASGVITFSEGKGLRALGLQNNQLVGFSAHETYGESRVILPDGGETTARKMFDRALKGRSAQGEVFISDRLYEFKLEPLCTPDGLVTGVVGVANDVTELRSLEGFRDEFIRIASHELRTPLTVAKGFAQLIQGSPQLSPEELRSRVMKMERGVQRIVEVVEEIFSVSDVLSGRLSLQPVSVDLETLARNKIAQFTEFAPKHRFTLRSSGPVVVGGDEERLRNAVRHLLNNAVRFSPRGGEIILTVKREGESAELSVQDFGLGIPKDLQFRVFQKFFRAHAESPAEYSGIGVGLYLVAEIIRRHGGTVGFESEAGKGSLFFFRLPLSAPSLN